MFNLRCRNMIRTDTELSGTWPRTCPVGSSEEVSDVFLIDRGFSDRGPAESARSPHRGQGGLGRYQSGGTGVQEPAPGLMRVDCWGSSRRSSVIRAAHLKPL